MIDAGRFSLNGSERDKGGWEGERQREQGPVAGREREREGGRERESERERKRERQRETERQMGFD